MGTVARAAVTAAFAALVVAQPAVGATPYRVGDTTSNWVVAGSRYAAFAVPTGEVRLYDGRRARWSTIRTPAGCDFASVSGGALMWRCPAGAHVLDLATGRAVDVPIDPAFYVTPLDVGAHWILASAITDHGAYPLWIDWRTGRYGNPRPLSRAGVVPDLNKASLYTRLCAGLRRRLDPNADAQPDPFLPYLYERPYGVQVSPGPPFPGRIVVRRCGRRNAVTLRGKAPSLGDGLLTWTRGSRGVAYSLRTGRQRTWHFNTRAVSVAHTKSRLFITVSPWPRTAPAHVFAVRRPGGL